MSTAHPNAAALGYDLACDDLRREGAVNVCLRLGVSAWGLAVIRG